MTEAYPLSWPPGWPRHKGQRDNDRRFKGPTYHWDRVYRGVSEELKRIGASDIVVSTNQPIRRDGMPYAQERNISDPGVAVYFMRSGKSLVMAQDRFFTVIGNMRSLTMSIEGLRQMERHGGGIMMDRAFDGFVALPPPESCWTVLGLDRSPHATISATTITNAFRTKVREGHSNGGDMDRLVKARDEALRVIA